MKVIFIYFKAQTDMETCPHDVYIFGVKMSDEVDDGSPDSSPAYHVIKLPLCSSVIPGFGE